MQLLLSFSWSWCDYSCLGIFDAVYFWDDLDVDYHVQIIRVEGCLYFNSRDGLKIFYKSLSLIFWFLYRKTSEYIYCCTVSIFKSSLRQICTKSGRIIVGCGVIATFYILIFIRHFHIMQFVFFELVYLHQIWGAFFLWSWGIICVYIYYFQLKMIFYFIFLFYVLKFRDFLEVYRCF